ncbi:MAG: hypothetical protein E6Z83_04520 [Pantoea sp.]|uniref:hypothetical protein n=1 Tax=Pantoea sp. TaxID=69393 RepID=UPI00290C7116|nr:hypothetical protein [Pantoea sp.]MDU5780054.1 hypothetical protein [Pantoea sp.]
MKEPLSINMMDFPSDVIQRCAQHPETLLTTLYEFELARIGKRDLARHNAVNLLEDARKQIFKITGQTVL